MDLFTNPGNCSFEGYGIAPVAYDHWIGAAPGSGASHGNWWNAVVWSEYRQMASGYMAEIHQRYGDAAGTAAELAGLYSAIAGALGRLSDKNMPTQAKIDLLAETKEKEIAAIGKVAALAASLRSLLLGWSPARLFRRARTLRCSQGGRGAGGGAGVLPAGRDGACIEGTRIVLPLVLDTLAAGFAPGQILRGQPSSNRVAVRAATGCAVELGHERVVAMPNLVHA